MSRRGKLITLIILIVLAIFLIVFLLMRARDAFNDDVSLSPEETPKGDVIEATPTVVSEPDASVAAGVLQSRARLFVERYGSFSSEANFANLRDVMPLMTAAFASRTQQQIDRGSSFGEFYAITTNVVSTAIDGLDEQGGTATVVVSTQREESTGSPQNTQVKYQDIVLEMVNEQGVWKVDSAEWVDIL